MKRIDCHSHILPGMDDGAASAAESLSLLNLLQNDSVDIVIATPHFYPQKETAGVFLERRAAAFGRLSLAMANGNVYPQVKPGAEVYFSSDLRFQDMKPLCIEGTDYLLLELPYQLFTKTLVNAYFDFLSSCADSGIHVILAHIERYFLFNSYEDLNAVLFPNIFTQINCDSVIDRRERRLIARLFSDGKIHLLGTDTHNIENRPPRFGAAEAVIRKKFPKRAFETLTANAEAVLENRQLPGVL